MKDKLSKRKYIQNPSNNFLRAEFLRFYLYYILARPTTIQRPLY